MKSYKTISRKARLRFNRYQNNYANQITKYCSSFTIGSKTSKYSSHPKTTKLTLPFILKKSVHPKSSQHILKLVKYFKKYNLSKLYNINSPIKSHNNILRLNYILESIPYLSKF